MIRPATREDATEIGGIFTSTRDLMTYLPRIPDEDRPRLGGWIVEEHEVWVAEVDDWPAGFAALGSRNGEDYLEHIYVAPEHQGFGLGTQLLDRAKERRPSGFRLWVFQKNDGARRFYERHGLRLVEITDGAGNEEREPDALYEWRPS